MEYIYIICPVRNVSDEIQEQIDLHAQSCRNNGEIVHNPKYDAPQEDTSGIKICDAHREAMMRATRVDIFWDVESKGSHFDLGMAFILGKPLRLIALVHKDVNDKSYAKVIQEIERRQNFDI